MKHNSNHERLFATLVIVGAVAGLKNGLIGASIGAAAMFAITGSVFLAVRLSAVIFDYHDKRKND